MSKIGNYVAVGCHYSAQINSLASPPAKKTVKHHVNDYC